MFLAKNFNLIVKLVNKTRKTKSVKPEIMIWFTLKFLQWFAIFMISFDTVSILEPTFKTPFTPICKTEASNSYFLAMLVVYYRAT